MEVFLFFFLLAWKRKVWFAFDNPGKAQLLVFKQNSCEIGYLKFETGNRVLFSDIVRLTFGFNSGLLSSDF